MSDSNGNEEPTEATPLLNSDVTKPIDSAIKASGANRATNGNDADATLQGDEEAGEAEGQANPLFEGSPEMAHRLHLLIPALSIGIFLSAADQTVVVSSYGRIASELKVLENASWIATSYFLTLTSFQPLYGKLSDIFGRKRALLFAYSVFGLGCCLCGLARNMNELLAARAFAGIGGGGMTTVVSILLSDIIPLRERGSWQGYMNIVYSFGSAAGGPLGGLLADSIGWRWSFLGQAPMCLIAFVAVYFILDLPKTDQSHWREKLAKVDFLGALTLVTAVFCLLLGLDRGSNVSWSDTITIVCCVVSVPLFVTFVFIEMKIALFPFAPGHIIFDRSLFSSYLCNFFSMAAVMATIFYLPLYFQAVDGISATSAGLCLLPATVCSVCGSVFGGVVMQKTGKYYWLTIICSGLAVLGSVVIFLCGGLAFNFSWGLIIGSCPFAFGGGAVITTTLISVIANADPKDQAIVTACSYLFRSLGSVIGVSTAATVVQQSLGTQLRAHLDSGHYADKIVERVRQSLDYIKELEPHTRDIVRLCYQKATDTAFGLTVAIGVASFICTWFVREKKLSR